MDNIHKTIPVERGLCVRDRSMQTHSWRAEGERLADMLWAPWMKMKFGFSLRGGLCDFFMLLSHLPALKLVNYSELGSAMIYSAESHVPCC